MWTALEPGLGFVQQLCTRSAETNIFSCCHFYSDNMKKCHRCKSDDIFLLKRKWQK